MSVINKKQIVAYIIFTSLLLANTVVDAAPYRRINNQETEKQFKIVQGRMDRYAPYVGYTQGSTGGLSQYDCRGRSKNNPNYCAETNTIGFAKNFYNNWLFVRPKAAVRAISAHEFGHAADFHINYNKNLARYAKVRRKNKDVLKGEQLADCVIGAYSKQFNDKPAVDEFIKEFARWVFPSASHGTPKQREKAARLGFKLGRVTKCVKHKKYKR